MFSIITIREMQWWGPLCILAKLENWSRHREASIGSRPLHFGKTCIWNFYYYLNIYRKLSSQLHLHATKTIGQSHTAGAQVRACLTGLYRKHILPVALRFVCSFIEEWLLDRMTMATDRTKFQWHMSYGALSYNEIASQLA